MQEEQKSSADYEVLAGGGVNEVVRIGATVRRPTGPVSPLIHGLLRHLQERGFYGAPALHEVTTDGFEILDFIPGDVCNYPVSAAAATVEALKSSAALLRAYHDHTVDYAGHVPVEGWLQNTVDPVEVVCHGDYAPHNVVLRGTEAVGIIDFDNAHPGPRLWDVAHGVYRWAPITAPGNADGFGTAEDQAVRTRIFCDSYGLDVEGRAGLVDAVIARVTAIVDFMKSQAAAGNAAFAGHLADGHHIQYLNDVEYLRDQRAVFEKNLT